MNARFYDPQIGRFMSADPVGGSASDPQSFNPYAYVGDNPLSLTDPTGLCFLGCFWHSSIFKVVAAVAVAVTLQYEVLPALAGDATGFAAAATIPASTEIAFAGVSGAAAGAISTGTWQGALLGAASAVTFYGIGHITTPWLTTPAADAAPDGAFTVTNYVGVGASAVVHGLAGGVISVAEGGNVQSGFLSAGVSDLPGPFYANNAAVAGMEMTVVGGASSVLGGGKFANGAETAGFSFFFNSLAHDWEQAGVEGWQQSNESQRYDNNGIPLDQYQNPTDNQRTWSTLVDGLGTTVDGSGSGAGNGAAPTILRGSKPPVELAARLLGPGPGGRIFGFIIGGYGFRMDYAPNPSPSMLHFHFGPLNAGGSWGGHRPWFAPWRAY